MQKRLWKLPIPESDPGNYLRIDTSGAGEKAAAGTAKRFKRLREERDKVTVTFARRELCKWLRVSPEGQSVEGTVKGLLGSPTA